MKRGIAGLTAVIAALASFCQAQQPPSLSFEVASIRPHSGPLSTIKGLTVSGPRITMLGYTVPLLVWEAYCLRGNWQLSLTGIRGRDELSSVYYDIVARAPVENRLSKDELSKMLQTLLADRFKLRVHREMKRMPVYALVAGKDGPKLKESPVDGECSVHVGVVSDGQSYAFSNCAITELADVLGGGLVDRPVIDQTGLGGKYDFRTVMMPAFMSRNSSNAAGLSPFTAVRSLGLKLEPQTAPIEIIAVNHVEKPTEN